MTEEMREEFRRDALAHYEGMREKWRDMIDAVELVEKLESAGIGPSDEEKKAHDDARPSVEKWRDGGARGLANGRETMKDMLAAVKLVENCNETGTKPSDEEKKAYDDALPYVQGRRDAAAAARKPRVLAVREVLLPYRENGLALPRIAEGVKAFPAFQDLTTLPSRVMAVKKILQEQVHGRNIFKQTCREDRAVGTLAKYGVVKSEIDADDERS